MNTIIKPFTVLILMVTALATGFWWGSSRQPASTPVSTTDPAETAPTERQILYYRNPMGLPDTSPVPKKDSMGMDYIPVYADEKSLTDSTAVHISIEKIQKLGVRAETAAHRMLHRTVQALATVQANERLLYTVSPKFEGWIQRLHVSTTGQKIKKGDALMDVYSPELITAQHDYLIAAKGMHWVRDSDPDVQAKMQRLSENALQRLYNWDIAESDLRRLQHEGSPMTYLPLRSAVNGIVIEKKAVQGKRFMPGDTLYEIADLSHVWVLAEVFEQDLHMLQPGQTATINVDAYPDRIFTGRVTFIYPTVTPETRTTRVRIELANEAALLKPDMYARVEFSATHGSHAVLTIPNSAILDSGLKKMVLIALGAGRFEPRVIKTGMQADEYTEVLSGLEAGEAVVTRANFLIDAESNLKAALTGFNPATVDAQINRHNEPAGTPTHTHHGTGIIQSIDWTHATVTIAHDPIASLKWPAMTMDFHVTDPALLQSVKPGQVIAFILAEQAIGGYAITQLHPAADSAVRTGHGSH
ncbi:MAG: efflux RND transporter periplasmic adaptor subunit [Nitrosomonas sp.]|nr:efflux RND transporter periplasmic adaptor subunit [Nitrosomonas sp.]